MDYSIIVILHIVAAAFLLGGGLLAPYTRRAIREARDAGALLTWLEFGHKTTRVNPIAALVLLASGVYLGSVGWWTEAWFYVAVALWAVNGGWAARAIESRARALAQVAAAGAPGPVSAEMDRLRRSRPWDVALDVLLANDLAALGLMVLKPGWVGSVAFALVANGALFALRAWRWRKRSERRSVELHGLPHGDVAA